MKKFTLLELLIVISIIALMISILLPSLTKAKKASELAVCSSNMKQISFVLKMFLKGNNQFFPIGIRNNRPYDDLISEYDGRNLTASEISIKEFENTSENRLRHQVYTCP